jgi:hypothetical protein
MADTPGRWYLLIHQLPPKPLYLRARIRQRLARVGALALKNSVYVLPRNEAGLEDLQWIAEEAVAGGGEAYLCEADFSERPSNEDIEARFRGERAADYQALSEQLRPLLRQRQAPGAVVAGDDELTSKLRRIKKRLDEVIAIDFFAAPGREEAETLARRLDERLHPGAARPATAGTPASRKLADLAGQVWVTRRGVHIDRIASAWLIRRFIDPQARFRFADSPSPAGAPGEQRFDTVGGEFTHAGEHCTFETLLAQLGRRDAALSEIAEIVHDLDLKDGKFGRADAPGILQLINGLAAAHADDLDRLDRGFAIFDDLYASFRRLPEPPAMSRSRPRRSRPRKPSKPRAAPRRRRK